VNVKQTRAENLKPFPECWFETTQATFGGYLPEALGNGSYKVAPPPLIVNRNGLEGIQEAIDLMRVAAERGLEGIKEVFGCSKEDTIEDKVSPIKLVIEQP
jgi:hypothetical protein